MKSVNVTNSDINMKTWFMPKDVNMFKIAASSKTGLTLTFIPSLPWLHKAAVPESWIILQTGGETWR